MKQIIIKPNIILYEKLKQTIIADKKFNFDLTTIVLQ